MKKRILFIINIILVAVFVFGGGDDIKIKLKPTKPTIKISAVRLKEPNGGEKWTIGQRYEIKYRLINVKRFHWVGLMKGKMLLGNFAGGNDIGSFEIKLGLTCGKQLLNGRSYSTGDNYKIIVYTLREDNTFELKDVSDGYFSVIGKDPLTIKKEK